MKKGNNVEVKENMERLFYLFVESQHVAHHLSGVRLLEHIAEQPCLRLKQVLHNIKRGFLQKKQNRRPFDLKRQEPAKASKSLFLIKNSGL